MRDNKILEIFKKIKTIERSKEVGDRETKQKGLPKYLEISTQVIEGRIPTRVLLVDQANLRIKYKDMSNQKLGNYQTYQRLEGTTNEEYANFARKQLMNCNDFENFYLI